MAAADCIEDEEDLSNYAHFGAHGPVEKERGRLQKAETILECMILAMHEAERRGLEFRDGPYFPDVAEIARNLMHEAILRLDLVELKKTREKIKAIEQQRGASVIEDGDALAEGGAAGDDAGAGSGDYEN